MSALKNFVIIAWISLTWCLATVNSQTTTTKKTTQTPNVIKWPDSGPSDEPAAPAAEEVAEVERQPRSLVDGAPFGYQTIQQVPIYGPVQQQPIGDIGGFGGGLLGGGAAAGGGIGGFGGAGLGGGFGKYHESLTVRGRGFGAGGFGGLGKFGLGGGLAGGGLAGGIGGLGGGRYKVRYTKKYGGGFAGAGLLGGGAAAGGVGGIGAGGIGGGLLG